MKKWIGYLVTPLILPIVFLSLSSCSANSYPLDEHAQEGIYQADSGSQAQEETAYFRLQINSNPQARQGERIPFLVGNPEENQEDVQVRVYLADTEEEIYCSPILHPGEREAYGSVQRELAPGDYEALAVFYILDEEGQETGSVETALVLTVEEAMR